MHALVYTGTNKMDFREEKDPIAKPGESLIKVKASQENRTEILEIAEIFRSKVVDLSVNSITLEVVGDPGKIITIQELLRDYEIIEIVRTGKVSLERELGINTEYLKNN